METKEAQSEAAGTFLKRFSGRVSSEILIKVAWMRIPVLIARGAPTDLALKMAQELGITVVGFARVDRFNVYNTHQERIRLLKI